MALKQMNYEGVRSKYNEVNSRFKRLSYLTNRQKKEVMDEIGKLNSFLRNNPEAGKRLEREMEIVLYDQKGTYNGNRLKVMAYWIRREEMNIETIKMRDDNVSVIELLNEPKLRKRMQKTNQAIENLRIAEIDENSNNINIRKFYLDIIDIYEESIATAKRKNMKYGGMLAGMEDAEKFNNFMVAQIDLSLASLVSKETARAIYPYKNDLFLNRKEITQETKIKIDQLKNAIRGKVEEAKREIEKEQKLKEKGTKMFKEIASGDRKASLEFVKEKSKEWKTAVPQSKENIDRIEKEISGMYLALSALERLENSA